MKKKVYPSLDEIVADVPDGARIGVDREADARRFHVTEKGVVLVTPDTLRRARGGGQ